MERCKLQEEERWGKLKGLSSAEMDVACGGEGAGLAWSLSFPICARGWEGGGCLQSLQGLVLPLVALSPSERHGWRQACIRRPEVTFLCLCQSLVPG